MICAVLDALGEIGPRARPALPDLTSMAENPRHGARMFAVRAMYGIRPEGRAAASAMLPSLITELTTGKSPQERISAAIFLGDMSSVAGGAIPALLAATKDPDQEVCRAAAMALEAVKRAANDAQPGTSPTPREP